MAIREQHDLFEALYKSNLTRLELTQLSALMIDMVREQVNNGRINGCKLLTDMGVEELVDKVKEDSHIINITHPEAKESLLAIEQESLEDDKPKDREVVHVQVVERKRNFSANINTRRTDVYVDAEINQSFGLNINPLLPNEENEWIVTVRQPMDSNPQESSADVIVDITTKGASQSYGNF